MTTMTLRGPSRAAVVAVVLALLCSSSMASTASCDEGYRATLTGGCEACKDPGCEKCLLSTSLCTKCSEGYFIALTGACTACPGENCKTCASLTGVCTGCPEGYELVKPNLLVAQSKWRSGYCRANSSVPRYDCDDGFHTTVTGECVACTTTNCKKCYLSSSRCSICEDGYYMTLTGSCVTCPGANCKTCAPLTGLCLTCSNGYQLTPPSFGAFLSESVYGYCAVGISARAEVCGDGYLTTPTKECVACETANCSKCYLNVATCTVCSDGFYLTENTTCMPCPGANCRTCAPLTGACTSCPDGYTFTPPNVGFMHEASETGFCSVASQSNTTECADGFQTGENGECTACEQQHCKKCYLSLQSCTVCDSGYYLTRGGTCEPCPGLNCKQCADLSGMCTGCSPKLTYVAPNMGNVYNSTKYGCCNTAGIAQQATIAMLVVVSFVVSAISA